MAYFDLYNVQNPLEICCVEQSVAPPFFEFLQMSVVEATYGNLALSPRKPRPEQQPSALPTLMYH